MMPIPKWATAADTRPHDRREVVNMVLAICQEVRQKLPNPERCATDAKPILALWRLLGKPDPAEFTDEFCALAQWARESGDLLASRDIRAEGWIGGVDRHRDIATLARQDKWTARLEMAQAWVAVINDAKVTATQGAAAQQAFEDRSLLGDLCDRGDAIQCGDPAKKLRLMRLLKALGGRDAVRARRKDEHAFNTKFAAEYPKVVASIAADIAKPFAAPTPEVVGE